MKKIPQNWKVTLPSGQELFFYAEPLVEVLIIEKFEIGVNTITKSKKYFIIKIDAHDSMTEEDFDDMNCDDEHTMIVEKQEPWGFYKYDFAKYKPNQCKVEQIGNDYTPSIKDLPNWQEEIRNLVDEWLFKINTKK